MDKESKLPRLSPRQQQCLDGILELKSAKQIGRDLGITQHAVEKHLKIVREKFGVSTTAEAARLYAQSRSGKDSPQYHFSALAEHRAGPHETAVPARCDVDEANRVGDDTGALSLDYPLTPRQTLLTIAAISFVSIVGLLLLVACAEGIRRVVSG